jgi:hypothetical protein
MLHDSLPYRAKIYIVGDSRLLEELSGGHFPDWGAAVAVPAGRKIVIKSPDRFDLGRSLGELLAHEYAHLALAHRCRVFSPPRWFTEGMAMNVSTEWSWWDNLTVSRAAVFGQLMPLEEIELVNRFPKSKAGVAYAQSYLAVKYLFDDYGVEGVNIFLDSIAAGGSVDAALMGATGSDLAGFDAEYRAMLARHFNFGSLFMDTIWLWLVLALIVLVGGILRFRKRRQYYRKWEAEERYQSTDFDYGDPDHPERIDDDDEPWRA